MSVSIHKSQAAALSVALGAALLLLAAIIPVMAGDLYKCGRTYSDQPCGEGQVKLAIQPAPAAPKWVDIKPGMAEADMLAELQAQGRPVKVITTDTAGATYRQFVVGRYVRTQSHIFTRDGVVTSVQW